MKTSRTLFRLLLFFHVILLPNIKAGVCIDSATPTTLLPSITCPPNASVNVSSSTCTAVFNYTINYSDGTLMQTSGLPSGAFPLGLTVNSFVVSDSAGNTAACSFSVMALDLVQPVAICKSQLTVSIGDNDQQDCYGDVAGNNYGGTAWLPVTQMDNGSYDDCSNILLSVRRKMPYSNCVSSLNSINGQPNCSDSIPDILSEFERAISENDSMKFYCCEAGSNVELSVRAYQLNPDGSLSIGTNGIPIYGECSLTVNVVDETKPTCITSPIVNIACEAFDPLLGQLNAEPQLFDNCCIDTSYYHTDWSEFDTICSRGTITRTYFVTDCNGNSNTCSRKLLVGSNQNYYIRFPDDVLTENCVAGLIYGEPVFFGEDCELLSHSFHDAIIDFIPDVCIRIERVWQVINWCTFNPLLPLINVPNPTPSAVSNHSSNWPGPIVSACGTTGPWAPTVVKIIPGDTVATNYCNFWSANANGYQYKQVIKIIDTTDPDIENCPQAPLTFADTTENDAALWYSVFNPGLPAKNLTETEVELSIIGADNCYGSDVYAEYQLFFDLDNNAEFETVVNSQQLGGYPGGLGWNNILYGNLFNAGVPTKFDNRLVPDNEKWGFAIQHSNVGNNKIASVKFNTMQSPQTFVAPQLPQGTHKIRWGLSDGCGNSSQCEYLFTIEQGALGSGLFDLPNADFALYQNQPNPFAENTSISFLLPEPAEATLSVYNSSGQLIHSQKGSYSQGLNTLVLNGESLQPGFLYYQLESDGKVAWQRMIHLR